MCISFPARVISVDGLAAQVEIGSTIHKVLLTVQASADDWVLVHAGCAIALIDCEHAKEMIAIRDTLAHPYIGE